MNNKHILKNAPKDATHASKNNYYKIGERGADCGGNLPCFMEYFKGDEWYQAEPDVSIRSLEDIRAIARLEAKLELKT